MNEKDISALAEAVAKHMMSSTSCHLRGTCQTFDDETIEAIRAAAKGYARLSACGRWAGGLVAAVIVTTLAAAFCAAMWRGFAAMLRAGQ